MKPRAIRFSDKTIKELEATGKQRGFASSSAFIRHAVKQESSTLAWIGFYIGIRALPGGRAQQSRWIIDSAVVAAAWLVGVFMLGAADVFRNDALPPRIPMALAATLLTGYLLLLSPTFRRIVAAVPQHWQWASKPSVS